MKITVIEHHEPPPRDPVGVGMAPPYNQKNENEFTKEELIEYINSLTEEKIVRISVYPPARSQ